ncbi:hypothetical protein L6164_029068 [Bauhinia variegata]|uniref:Uncharacterized protein n=1 Tax=Bauhinia variegata TaxID=167791 RepID=A0ACB9L7N3_BAUVA|nr:hypothetical protein L6164_029068 [Bauhinia variegata]
MALQAGVQTSKILILVGAGLTGSVVLRSGRLSELIAQLQDLLNGVNEAEILPGRYDTALLAAQIRQLAQEIKELTLSQPITIFNGNSSSAGSFASYILPAAAVGALGYCYMRWKGLSFSDVMFVTKRNMAEAVATVAKQLENVHETIASTKRHLTKRLEGLDWKLNGQMELSRLISTDVNEMKTDLSQIGCDVDLIYQMLSGLEGKANLLESKQDTTNAGILYLSQFAQGFKDEPNSRVFREIGSVPTNRSKMALEDKSPKGLQFIAETTNTVEKSVVVGEKKVGLSLSNEEAPVLRPRIHRSFPVGISLGTGIAG